MTVVTNRAASSSIDQPDCLLTPIFPHRKLMGTDIKEDVVTEIFNRAYPRRIGYKVATGLLKTMVFVSVTAFLYHSLTNSDSDYFSPRPRLVAMFSTVFLISLLFKVLDPSEEIKAKKRIVLRHHFSVPQSLRRESLSFFFAQLPPSSETVHYYRLLSFPQVLDLTGKDIHQIRAICPFLNPYLKMIFQRVLEKQEELAQAPCFADAVMNPEDRELYQETPLLLEAVISVLSPLYENENVCLREYQKEIQPEIDRLQRMRSIQLIFDKSNHAQVAKFYFRDISERFRERITPSMTCLDVSEYLTKHKFDLLSGALLAESLDHLDEEKKEIVKEVAFSLGITCSPFNYRGQ